MFELSVLFLKLLDPLEVVELHTAILGLPIIDCSLGNAMLAGYIQDVLASIILLENVENLGFGESGLLHS